jgi:hypothetical protein
MTFAMTADEWSRAAVFDFRNYQSSLVLQQSHDVTSQKTAIFNILWRHNWSLFIVVSDDYSFAA